MLIGVIPTIVILVLTTIRVNAETVGLTSLPKAVQDTLTHYSDAVINTDVKQIRQLLHPLQLKDDFSTEQGTAKVYQKLKVSHLLPEKVEFGDTELFSSSDDRLYFVPYVSVQKGFPADVREGHLYIVVSNDAGKSWKIVDNDCGMSKEFVQKLSHGYKGEPSLEKLYKKARELANNPLPHSTA